MPQTACPKRVAFVVTTLGTGGTERYVHDLAIELSSNGGVKVLVIVDSEPLIKMESLLRRGIEVECLAVAPHWTRANYQRALKEALVRFRPGLVHMCAWLRQDQIAETARDCGLAIIETRHCTDEAPRIRDVLGLNRVPFGLYRERARARRLAVPAICISYKSQANVRRRWRNAVPTAVVYNGIPCASSIKNWSLTGNQGPAIAWVGSMIERKQPLAALQIFRQVSKTCAGLRMTMMGDGPLRQAVAREAACISERIRVAGYCETVSQVLAESSLYLQTAAAEGIAYSVLEAMSAGLPVVATDVGATAEAVVDQQTGFLVPFGKLELLARQCECLVSDVALSQKLGTNALQRFQKQFTLARMTQETLRAYELLCGVRLNDEASDRLNAEGALTSAKC